MVAHRCRVGLDFDGLLFEFYALILAWRYNLKFEDALYIVRHHWPSPLLEKSWGGTGEQAGALVTQFYRELNFSKIELVDGAEDMIQTLGAKYDLYLVTSNAHFTDDQFRALFNRLVPGLIRGIVRTNMWGTKIEAMLANDLACLVEDRFDYAEPLPLAGLKATVVDRYPWSYGPRRNGIRHVATLASVPWAVDKLLAA